MGRVPVSSSPFWIVAALLLLGATFGLLLALVRRWRRLPLPLAGTIALAFLVCAEAALFQLLSLGEAVSRSTVATAHLVFLLVGGGWLLRTVRLRGAAGLRPGRFLPAPRWHHLMLVPVLALVLASATRYAPNSGDSMTYHLARVAHWIENGSVMPYPTGSVRQTVMMPGAEYVLLALQAVSGSDALASLLQLTSYVLVVLAAPPLARLAGAPSALAPFAAPLVATLPMAVLQASSTQNDMIASAMALAVLSAALPFLHRGRRRAARALDVLIMAAACTAGLLVKASALLAVAPLVALAAVGFSRRARLAGGRRAILALAAGSLLGLLAVGSEVAMRGTDARLGAVLPTYSYPVLGEWPDRAANVVRSVFHHLPPPSWIPVPFRAAAKPEQAGWLGASQLEAHEDLVGNPLQALLVIAACAVLVIRFQGLRLRARVACSSLLVAWVAFHLIFRDNEFLSRLELPLFALSPVFLAVVPRARSRPLARVLASGVAALCLAYGVAVAARNELRPPLRPRTAPRELDYYRNAPIRADPQLAALRAAEESGCRRIGLFMGESGFDYPITWLGMRSGIEVRHVMVDDGWPCLIFAEHLSWGAWGIPRPPVALDPAEWSAVAMLGGRPYLFLRTQRTGKK